MVCAGVLAAATALADNNFQAANGDWNVAGNWSGGVPVPSRGTVVNIANGGTVTYTSSMGNRSLFGEGEFHIGNGEHLERREYA